MGSTKRQVETDEPAGAPQWMVIQRLYDTVVVFFCASLEFFIFR
jgi:hypothetical protein